jgi:hypothetical protein
MSALCSRISSPPGHAFYRCHCKAQLPSKLPRLRKLVYAGHNGVRRPAEPKTPARTKHTLNHTNRFRNPKHLMTTYLHDSFPFLLAFAPLH